MAQKKTAGAAQPAAKTPDAGLTLIQPATETEASATRAAPPKAPTKAKAAKRAAPARKPKTQPSAPPPAAYEDYATAGQDAIETYVTCSKIAAEGVETLGKEVVSFARASVQAQLDLARTLMDAKTFQDALDAQSDYAAKNIDHLAAQAAKLTDMSLKLANEIMEPIQARAQETAQTWLKPMAA